MGVQVSPLAPLLSLYPEFDRIYGPYLSPQKRRLVVLVGKGRRKTIALAKALLEIKIGRRLASGETADHIDDDPLNDNPDNLQVLPLLGNILKSKRPAAMVNVICPQCGKPFRARQRRVRGNQQVQGKAGPFCSKSCAGIWSQCTNSPP